MVPPIQRDNRVWMVAIHSDICPMTCEHGITECCRLQEALKGGDVPCTFENCPIKVAIGNQDECAGEGIEIPPVKLPLVDTKRVREFIERIKGSL